MSGQAVMVSVNELAGGDVPASSLCVGAESGATPTNVAEFPKVKDRTQDIILNLILEGHTYAEVARITGYEEWKVSELMRTTWAQRMLQEKAESGDEGAQQTIRSLLRSQALNAVLRLGKLIDSDDENVAMRAITKTLEYTLSPQREIELIRAATRAVPPTEAAQIERLKVVQREIDSLAQRKAV